MPSPRRRLVIVAACVLTLALLAGGEWAVRARGGDSLSPALFYQHSRTPHAFIRGVRAGTRISINRLGFRGPDVPLVKPPGTTRVLVVGASTTFDPCVPNDAATWPAQLERQLNALAPGRRFEVLNSGAPGYEMIDHNVRLLYELHEVAPDVILMYAGHGVVNRAHLVRPIDAVAGVLARPDAAKHSTALGRWLTAHSYLYNATALRLRRAIEGPLYEPSMDEWAGATATAEKEFRDQLGAFGRMASGFAPHVVFVELAHAPASGPAGALTDEDRAMWRGAFRVPAEVVLEGYRRFHGVWLDVAGDVGASFVPASALSLDRREYFCLPNPIHFSAEGSEAMGRRLADALLELPAFAAPDSGARR